MGGVGCEGRRMVVVVSKVLCERGDGWSRM